MAHQRCCVFTNGQWPFKHLLDHLPSLLCACCTFTVHSSRLRPSAGAWPGYLAHILKWHTLFATLPLMSSTRIVCQMHAHSVAANVQLVIKTINTSGSCTMRRACSRQLQQYIQDWWLLCKLEVRTCCWLPNHWAAVLPGQCRNQYVAISIW